MKILIVQLGRFGDMILATPAFRAIKEKLPDASLHVLSGRHNNSVIRNNPRIDRIIVFEKTPLKYINTLTGIRKEKYDYYIDPKDHPSGESRLFARSARAVVKIGYNNPGQRIFDAGIHGLQDNAALHYVQKYMNALKPLGINIEGVPRPELFVSAGSEKYTGDFLESTGNKPFILVNISAGRDYGMWQDESWIKLAGSLSPGKYNIILCFAPAQAANAETIAARSAGVKLFRSRSFEDLFPLVQKASLVVSPDTSIIHIAAAFDTPVVGLYGCLEDNYTKFRPLSTISKVVRAPAGADGIKTIIPESVIPVLNEMVESLVVSRLSNRDTGK